ncbi:MAG: signal recognition particle-docking protein FtsY [Chlamydiae bacterium]|nr:signal recognition particle-docking protein FtsY [Chlamydiota bacterium]
MLSFLKNRFQKVKQALLKTHSALSFRLSALVGKPWNDETFEELEHILYEADLGSECINELISHLRSELRLRPMQEMGSILELLKQAALKMIPPPESPPLLNQPHIILVVGVNGSGKTTTIAKLAHHFQEQGKKVLVAAGDTFRAAAIDQLTHWADKLGIHIIKSKPGADPSGVAFDALSAATSRGYDLVIIDTAGRLQNKTDLMQELEKVKRICQKQIPASPHETLLVLDATTGQNAIDQAAIFHQFTPLTGIVLTKLDGSAKGGIVLAIYKKLKIPVQWIGVGEGVDDLMPFNPKEYVEALFES